MKKVWVVTGFHVSSMVWSIHVFENENRAKNFYKKNKDLSDDSERFYIQETILITEDMYNE